MNKIIESIVMVAFGVIVLLLGIFTSAGMEVIVASGLLTLVGIIFLVMELVNKK